MLPLVKRKGREGKDKGKKREEMNTIVLVTVFVSSIPGEIQEYEDNRSHP